MGDNKSDKKYSREIVLAKWEDRFVAWLIDFVIISIIIVTVIVIVSLLHENLTGQQEHQNHCHLLVLLIITVIPVIHGI